MPSYVVRNQDFRDEVLKYAYPFDELSELEEGDLFIGTDLFVDAVLYPKVAREMPFHISVVDGTYGATDEALIIINDKAGLEVGRAVIHYSKTEVDVLSPDGIRIGALVMNPDGLHRFLGRVAGKLYTPLPSVARFLLDVCHVSTIEGLRYITAGETAVSGNVRIVARHGVRFVETDTGIRLDILGGALEETDLVPVRSINGVRNQSIWLTTHPRANMRMSNEGGQIRVTQAKEAK